jgi:hypothetical protein
MKNAVSLIVLDSIFTRHGKLPQPLAWKKYCPGPCRNTVQLFDCFVCAVQNVAICTSGLPNIQGFPYVSAGVGHIIIQR